MRLYIKLYNYIEMLIHTIYIYTFINLNYFIITKIFDVKSQRTNFYFERKLTTLSYI